MNPKIIKLNDNLFIYFENIRKYYKKDLFESFYRSLPEYRKRKTDRLKTIRSKCLSLSAENLLRYALKDSEPDIIASEPEFNEYGKGFFPSVSDVFQYNISHSGNYAVCAVNYGPEQIGCDIEKIRKVNLDVAKRFFTSNEYDTVMSCLSEERQTEMFFRVWTLKESFIKAMGTGLSTPMNSFEIDFSDPDDISIIQNSKKLNYSLGTLNTIPGYCISWCVEQPT